MANQELTYETLDRPYNSNLERSDNGIIGAIQPSSENGSSSITGGGDSGSGVPEINDPNKISDSAISGSALTDIWLETWMKSRNYKPKSQGFLIDGQRGYIECMELYVGSGGIVGGSLDIPNTTNADSFHVASNGNTWWGTNTATGYLTAPAYILNTGEAKFKNVSLQTNVTITDIQAGSEISIQGWSHDLVFSSTDADTVAWASGSIKLMDGTIYSIDAGNTGNMTARTYIYLNRSASITVLQTSITATDAVGTGEILIAVAEDSTSDNATFQVFGGIGGLNVDANNISANCITANLINVSQLSAISADIGTITAGNMTIDTSGFIRAGATGYLSGTGYWLGYDASAYKLHIGDPTDKYLAWTGTDLILSGYKIFTQKLKEYNDNFSDVNTEVETGITDLTIVAEAGDATVTVTSSAAFSVGEVIDITDGIDYERKKISNIPNGTSLTFSSVLLYDYGVGSAIGRYMCKIFTSSSLYDGFGWDFISAVSDTSDVIAVPTNAIWAIITITYAGSATGIGEVILHRTAKTSGTIQSLHDYAGDWHNFSGVATWVGNNITLSYGGSATGVSGTAYFYDDGSYDPGVLKYMGFSDDVDLGNGADGAFVSSGNATLPYVANYSSVTINAGDTLTVPDIANIGQTGICIIKCQGTFTLNGKIDGKAGGNDGGPPSVAGRLFGWGAGHGHVGAYGGGQYSGGGGASYGGVGIVGETGNVVGGAPGDTFGQQDFTLVYTDSTASASSGQKNISVIDNRNFAASDNIIVCDHDHCERHVISSMTGTTTITTTSNITTAFDSGSVIYLSSALESSSELVGSGGGGGGALTGGGGSGGTGGLGGGMIVIFCKHFIRGTDGEIDMDGGKGGDGKTSDGCGAGGGSGGSIYIRSNFYLSNGGTSKFHANGGAKGLGYLTYPDGGAGGNGRIRIESNDISGTTSPTYYSAGTLLNTTVYDGTYYAVKTYQKAISNVSFTLTREVVTVYHPDSTVSSAQAIIILDGDKTDEFITTDIIDIYDVNNFTRERKTISAIDYNITNVGKTTITVSSNFSNSYLTTGWVARVDFIPYVSILDVSTDENTTSLIWRDSEIDDDSNTVDYYTYQTTTDGHYIVFKIFLNRNDIALVPKLYDLAVDLNQ